MARKINIYKYVKIINYVAMMNFIYNPDRFRVDTEIKIYEPDGSEITVPVVVIIKVDKLNDKQQSLLHRITYGLFNKKFIIDKRIKETPPVKKSRWKFW